LRYRNWVRKGIVESMGIRLGLRAVRLTGTAVHNPVRYGYGHTVHRPSKRVSKVPTETDGDGDGRLRHYGYGRVIQYILRYYN